MTQEQKPSNREKILDAAERLFAKRGSQAVSLREINTAAGVSQGVLHYQFGGREGLIEALLDRRLPAITEYRRRYLAQIDADKTPFTYRQLVEVLLLPLARLALEEGSAGQRFLRLMDNLSRENNPTFQRVVRRYFDDLRSVFDELAQQVFPYRPLEDTRYRLLVISYSMYMSAAELANPHWAWMADTDPATSTPEQRLEILIDMYCHGLSSSRSGR